MCMCCAMWSQGWSVEQQLWDLITAWISRLAGGIACPKSSYSLVKTVRIDHLRHIHQSFYFFQVVVAAAGRWHCARRLKVGPTHRPVSVVSKRMQKIHVHSRWKCVRARSNQTKEWSSDLVCPNQSERYCDAVASEGGVSLFPCIATPPCTWRP